MATERSAFISITTGLKSSIGFTPVVGKLVSRGVLPLNQCDAFGAIQSFNLFLAANGVPDELKQLEIHQPIDFVTLCETLDFARLVLFYSPLDVVGHSA